ncbi:MAG: 50S ribosomal protein L13 [Candidatus Kerfeldbacteria bacterium]|nr:50S ribosomal protein L13 [Candidatus Kerfeldbacteria bacterium]
MADTPMKQYDVDAAGQPLGRVASRVASLLRGKQEVTFAPHIAPNVRVTVHNVRMLTFTGTKQRSFRYYRHSNYPGGLTSESLGDRFARDPERFFRGVVRTMLPDNRLRSRLLRHLVIKD